ncbi:MAG: 3-phosphoshikimate 1-carboxyvinyltransferase [Clostridia bacterium]|nr:3-phosphoshikimate 1-carboxyvinyltransferase [Clostridia bacterium]
MTVEVLNAYISGQKNAIPSKSYAHRIAICNFLAGKTPTANIVGFTSNDISVTENCLRNIRNGIYMLDCGESGSTLRFLLPLCSALGGEYTFIGHGKLMERPNDELFAVLESHKISVEKKENITLKGKLTNGEFRIRGDISSQYISGLLMALPMLEGDSQIVLTTPLVSAPYVEITLQVLRDFGIKIDKTANGFTVYGNQKFVGRATAEGDWSNEAFFLVLGAINGDITVHGLNADSVQGDKAIIDILKSAGAFVEIKGQSVTVKKSELKGFSFDAESCPDLVPITAVLASFADGKTVIKNIQRLKIKESDRVESTISLLNSFGIKAESDGKNLTVYGGTHTAGVVDSFNDHRIAMAGAVMATATLGKSVINTAQAVNKSYPTFYKDLNSVGGKAYEV